MGSAHSCCTNSGKSTADTVNLENNCEHVTADEYIDPSLGMFSDIDINSDRKPFKVTLTRDGPHWNNIGVVLSPDDSPDYLTIDDVNYPSLLGFWNERCHKHQKVKAGDMIRAVNEMSSTGEQMLLMIQTIGKGEEIRFLIEAGPENFGDRTSFEPQKADSPRRSRGKPKVPSAARKYPELRPHFEALDISQDSSNNDIRRHYRRLARIWHPDKNPDNYLEATRRFQAINTAYLAIKAKLNL